MKKLILFFLKKYATYNKGFRIEVCKVLQDCVADEYYEDNIWGHFYASCGEMMKANPMYKCEGEKRKNLAAGLADELDWINDYKIKK